MSVFTIGKVKKYLSVSWINFGRTEEGEWDKKVFRMVLPLPQPHHQPAGYAPWG